MKLKSLIIFTFCIPFIVVFSQNNESEDTKPEYHDVFLISPVISVQFPGADMAKRFGIGYQFGLAADYKFKANWQIGAEGGFLFGTKVKETDHIKHTLASNGQTITNEGPLDDVNLNLRGAIVKLNAGKGFYFRKSKPNSGLLVKLGIGYMQHKILIDVDKKKTPQLTGNYAKGYDRFSNGILLSQYIGLIKLNKGKFVNLALGFELTEAFTHNARPYDFYLNQKLKETRVDLMYGIKLNWYIPVYFGKTTKSEYYYY
ncbi:MAG: hypothetical protein KDE33_16145 [Bacteroidetes bacterium]|nr:hypothetical protein [Bacteroidota bacterium]MCB9226985.1 hypothetical protein [Chitinophagales bacterium]